METGIDDIDNAQKYKYLFLEDAKEYLKKDLISILNTETHSKELLEKIDKVYSVLKQDETKYQRDDYHRDYIISLMLKKGNEKIIKYITESNELNLQLFMRSLKISNTSADRLLDIYNNLDSEIKMSKLSYIINSDIKENYYERGNIGYIGDKIHGLASDYRRNGGSINNLLECEEEQIVKFLFIVDCNDNKNKIETIGRYFNPINTSNNTDQAKKLIKILLTLDNNDVTLIYPNLKINSLHSEGSLGDMLLYCEEDTSLEIINELITNLRAINIGENEIGLIIYDIFNNRIPSQYLNLNKSKNDEILKMNIRDIAYYTIKKGAIKPQIIQDILDKILKKLIIEYAGGNYKRDES